jgi:hypothetical protein
MPTRCLIHPVGTKDPVLVESLADTADDWAVTVLDGRLLRIITPEGDVHFLPFVNTTRVEIQIILAP